MHLSDNEKRQIINTNTRKIAYSVFNHRGKPNFINAYDKLKATVLLQYGFNINDRIQSANTKETSIFDVLHGDELDMVYNSSLWLINMYGEVIKSRTA